MKHCFMILAHNQPKMLQALLSQIDIKDNTIIIHVDKKSKIKLFEEAFSSVKNAKLIVLKKRKKIYWGHYSIIKAEYNLFNEAIKYDFDYCHLLSGQDLLIKPIGELENYLTQTNLPFYNSARILEGEEYHNKAFNRVRLYHFIKQNPAKERLNPKAGKFREKVLSIQKRLIINRCKKESKKYAYGEQWFTASKEFLGYLLTQQKKNLKRYKLTHCPDELFIQTDYVYSPFYTEKSHSLLYVDWGEDKENPKTLDLEDLERLVTSDKFIARKFSENNYDLVEEILKKTIN